MLNDLTTLVFGNIAFSPLFVDTHAVSLLSITYVGNEVI